MLPVGPTPPNPLELLERPALGLLLRELKTKFDRIIVDTPAAVHGTDGPVIASKCGAALIIARQDKSRVAAIENLVRVINMGSVRIVGSVVNEF